ncbi:MAG TPA: hypothetical protein VL749_03480 [Patescibacteria group bacterium]|nr:hypothetical protein [Patescibacteria group bacterium]
MGASGRATSWAKLGARARAWRLVHALWSIAQLAALAGIWTCAILRRRSGLLWAGVAFIVVEGGALVVGRGSCPVGPRQVEWGDPVPFFELVLPPRAAKAAIPVLAVASLGGIAMLIFRRPGLVSRA